MADLEFSDVFDGEETVEGTEEGGGKEDPAEVGDDELFADLGMVDPYTEEPIRTKADFLAWKRRFMEEQREAADAPDNSGDDPLGQDVPETQTMTDPLRGIVEGELAKIRSLDREITDLESLAACPYFPRIYEKVMRGYALSDAYSLAKAEEQRHIAEARARRSDDLKRRGKEHLKRVTPRGGGEISVPNEVMAEFQRLLPDATKEEIRRFYRKDHKRQRRKS